MCSEIICFLKKTPKIEQMTALHSGTVYAEEGDMEKIYVLLFVCFLSLMPGRILFAQDAYNMEGVAGFVEGRARSIIGPAFSENGIKWLREGFSNFQGDSDFKQKVEVYVRQKFKEWLPGQIEDVMKQGLFASAPEDAEEEVRSIAGATLAKMKGLFDERIDAIIGDWYEKAIEALKGRIPSSVPDWVDITDLKGTARSAFDLQNIGDLAAKELGGLIGDATVAGIRSRIEDALDGKLPPEVIDALKKGPDEFNKYVESIKENLPGNKLKSLTNSIINDPFIKLPTPAYAAMLAASAAGHFAKAYNGIVIDPFEIKRGIEVTRVMIWQIKNKEWISLSIMQLSDIARNVAANFGVGEAYEGVLSKIKQPIDKLEKELDRIDAMIMKPIERVQEEIKEITKTIQKELKEIQKTIMKPANDAIAKTKDELASAGDFIADSIPEEINGFPKTWDEVKERFGFEDTFGDIESDFLPLGPTAAIDETDTSPPESESMSEELDPVLIATGEYIQEVTDLMIPGRGIDFEFTRIFRGNVAFLGELGRGWTHSYAERLLLRNEENRQGLVYVNERGRKYFFPMGKDGFISPQGLRSTLTSTTQGYLMHDERGLDTEFDDIGRPLKKTDRFGNQMIYEYAKNGLLRAVVDVFGRRVRFDRTSDGLIRKITDFAGRVFLYEYNDEKELIGVSSPATLDFKKGKTTVYRYERLKDGRSEIAMIMDPEGGVFLRNLFDEKGRIVAQSYRGGPWMTVAYDDEGRSWVTDESHITTLYEHDKEKRLSNLWRYEGGRYSLIESHLYDEDGRDVPYCGFLKPCASEPESKDDLSSGDNDRYVYGSFGEILSETDAAGAVTKYEYYPCNDPDGDGVKIQNALHECVAGYLRRMEKNGPKVALEDSVKSFEYDPVGNITAVSDSDGNKVKFTVNALNQITREEYPDNSSVSYFFDANDNLIKIQTVDGRGVVNVLERDVRGRPVELLLDVNGIHAETKYIWSDDGRLARLVDANKMEWTFEYDHEGRLVTEDSQDGRVRHTIYNDAGLIVKSVEESGVTIEIERDASGKMIARRATSGVPGVRDVFQTFEYDDSGRLVRATNRVDGMDPIVETILYYDGSGRIYAESTNGRWLYREFDSETQDAVLILPSNDVGLRLSSIEKNEVYSEIKRDAAGREIERSYFTDLGVLRAGMKTSYDANGTVSSEIINPGVERFYKRDSLDRLIEVKDVFEGSIGSASSGIRKWSYEYDKTGHIVGQIPEETQTKDAFQFDALGRLVGVSRDGEKIANYAYDIFDRRIEKNVNGQSHWYIWDGWWLAGERDEAGRTAGYIYDGNRLAPYARVSEDGVEHIIADRQGSVRETSERGVITGRCNYDPYGLGIQGEVESRVPGEDVADCAGMDIPFGFSGQLLDRETGLYYMRHRYYDPRQKIFISPDPLGVKVTTKFPAAGEIDLQPAFHNLQGQTSHATFSNRPGRISPHYNVYPLYDVLWDQLNRFKFGETNLFLYAKADPSSFADPLGLASLLFDRSDKKLSLYGEDGKKIESYDATNNPTKPDGDPLKKGSNGPFPNGTYTLGIPEFYSEEYRQQIIDTYELDTISKSEAVVNGTNWKKDRLDTLDYNAGFGRVRVRTGSFSGNAGDKIAAARGLFLHGGRHNYRAKTLGCIRVDDEDIELLALEFINLQRDGDPITTITVQD